MLSADMNHGLMLLSRGGLGKTTLVLDSLQERNLERDKHFIYSNSFMTPLGFYKLLDRTNQLKKPNFLILDDIELILSNKHILGMLRSALWEAGGKRIINYTSTSEKVEKEETEFRGKIILLINSLPKENKILGALTDRVFFHEINLTNHEVMHIIKTKIVRKPYKRLTLKQRIKIADAIEERVTSKVNLSFRTLIKAYQFYIFNQNHWTVMLDATMGVQPEEGLSTGKDVDRNTLL